MDDYVTDESVGFEFDIIKNENTIAVLIPCMNMSDRFQETYKSLISQSYSNWHGFFINSGKSTEDLKRVIDEMNNKYGNKLKFFQHYGKGYCGEMFEGIYNYVQDYNYFVIFTADDYWLSYKLEYQMKIAKEKDKCIFISGGFARINSQQFRDDIMICDIPNQVSINPLTIKKRCHGQHASTFFFDRECLMRKEPENGFCNLKYNLSWDWEFLIECYRAGIPMYQTGPILSYYTVDLSLTNNMSKAERHKYNEQNMRCNEYEFVGKEVKK